MFPQWTGTKGCNSRGFTHGRTRIVGADRQTILCVRPYLHRRVQFDEINKSRLQVLNVFSGILQRSVLGSVLLLAHKNESQFDYLQMICLL